MLVCKTLDFGILVGIMADSQLTEDERNEVREIFNQVNWVAICIVAF